MKKILLLLLISFSAFGYQNDLALKGGLGITSNTVHGRNNTEDTFVGYGINSHFGYRWVKWEFNVSSHIFFGKAENIEFQANHTTIVGNGIMRTVSFGPSLKYITDFQVAPHWYAYMSAGPTWSLKTVSLNEYTSTGNQFRDHHKLTYLSRGGIFTFGAEEILDFKEQHPVYLEFLFGFYKAYEVSIVDARDYGEVQTLSTESADNDIEDLIFMINFGMTIF